MITIRPLSWAPVCFILFTGSALAVLQNVTVDDAATTGAVVPTYLPSPDSWNIGNNCSVCVAKPDPALAYNGTWHDTTFSVSYTIFQSIEFSFEGSGMFIFFILANYVPGATTFTNVKFILDGVQVSTFAHDPTTSTDYEYNQAVYANSSIPYGQHTMIVAPINDTVNNVLILFDYFIYTTDTGTSSAIQTLATAISPTTAAGTPTSSSGQNVQVGAIVGGVIAGVGALVAGIMLLFCYRRRKRRAGAQNSPAAVEVEPFQQTTTGLTQAESRRKTTTTTPEMTVTVQSSNPAFTVTQPSSTTSSSSTAELLEQFGNLREEVARLRRLHDQSWHRDMVGSESSEPPPEYS